MGLHFDGEYFAKARDAGPYVPPSIPSDAFRKNYDNIRWDKEEENGKEEEEIT